MSLQNKAKKEVTSKLSDFLLGQLVDSSVLESLSQRLADESDSEAVVERLERIFSWQDDPEWLQAIAAARDGLMMPEVNEFLEQREALTDLAPLVVEEFDSMLAFSPDDDEPLLPEIPTFAEQFKAQQADGALTALTDKPSAWIQALGFQWQRLRESGHIIIQLLQEAFGGPQLVPIAVKNHTFGKKESDVVRHITLGSEESGGVDIEAIIRHDHTACDPQTYILNVHVLIHYRWEWSGTVVKATAGDWQACGTSNEEGEVILFGMPVDKVEQLSIEVTP